MDGLLASENLKLFQTNWGGTLDDHTRDPRNFATCLYAREAAANEPITVAFVSEEGDEPA